ncbi:hypothetical protein ACICHK_26900 [Streptomyces sp. AHU1]|uniref:hypothetical protein n=1 Tax=Streptomyces sp. AHU1 TaxID=3377215 RepID=UPI003877F871
MYNNAFYSYFRLQSFSLGLSFTEIAFKSLQLFTMPVLITMILVAVAPQIPEVLSSLGLPSRVTRDMRRVGKAVVRGRLLFVLFGVGLMALWPHIQPYGWVAPLVVDCGLLLSLAAPTQRQPWKRGASITMAALLLIWAVGMAGSQQGEKAAERTARQLVQRTSVVLLSTERLTMAGSPGPLVQDLGAGQHYRYRYSRLHLLVERDKRYYLIPMGWDHRTGPTYVIDDDDSVRIELYPGTQPPR